MKDRESVPKFEILHRIPYIVFTGRIVLFGFAKARKPSLLSVGDMPYPNCRISFSVGYFLVAESFFGCLF
jgi:hypothetical protein